SSRVAWRQGPQGSKQHLALAASATRTRTQRPRKYLAIHAAELVVEPNFQILRRHCRSLLLRLEHAHRSAVENHVHRPPRLGSRTSLNVRIGIIQGVELSIRGRASAGRASRLFFRHIGKFNKLASVRERDPGVSHTHIIFALLRVVCFLCKHRALSGRFPCRVAFGSHLFDSPCRPALHPHALNATTIVSTAGLTFLLLESICREPFSSSSDYPRFVSAGVRS